MRLIDADHLLFLLNSAIELRKKLHRNTSDLDVMADTVNDQPTAYDPDKVVEQLGKLKKAEQDRPDDCDEDGCGDGEQIYDDGRSQGRFEAFGKAIEIVKGGGVK